MHLREHPEESQMNNPAVVASGAASFPLVDMIGLWVGVFGLLLAVVQTVRARSAKRIYRNGCKIRCRDASDKAQRLADNMVELCKSINSSRLYQPLSSSPESVRAYAQLSGHIGASLDVAKDWVRFCFRLNEEHQDEFKESAITEEQLKDLMLTKNCLAELEPAHIPTSNESGRNEDKDEEREAQNARVPGESWRRH
jgi:hypothetical protein